MKKTVIFLVIVVAILGIIWYSYEKAKINTNEKISYNYEYESLLNKEIDGNRLATIINKASNSNENNYIEKDDNGIYLENDSNSIKIEIQFIDNDNTIKSEKISQNEISKFIGLYGNHTFILTKIEYHSKTKLIKYLYFEEI